MCLVLAAKEVSIQSKTVGHAQGLDTVMNVGQTDCKLPDDEFLHHCKPTCSS